LTIIETVNFSNDKIQNVKTLLVEYLCELFKNSIATDLAGVLKDEPDDEDQKPVSNTEDMEYVYLDNDDDFDPCAEIYEQVFQEEKAMEEMNNKNTKESQNEEQQRLLRERITNQVNTYWTYCSNLDIEEFLNDYGNAAYEDYVKDWTSRISSVTDIKHRQKIVTEKIKKMKDPVFVGNMTDIMKWWNICGQVNYKEMSCGACILFGKPTHNGFQERVFSRGTYADCKLKKNLKEENFEMKVLNSLNVSEINKIMSEININKNLEKTKMIETLISFFKEEETEPILSVDDLSSKNAEEESIFNDDESDNDMENDEIDDIEFEEFNFDENIPTI
jgi:hypothetical protein